MAHDEAVSEAAVALRMVAAECTCSYNRWLRDRCDRLARILSQPSPLLTRDVLPDECDEDPGDDPREPSCGDVAALRGIASYFERTPLFEGSGEPFDASAAMDALRAAIACLEEPNVLRVDVTRVPRRDGRVVIIGGSAPEGDETDEQKARRVLGELLADHQGLYYEVTENGPNWGDDERWTCVIGSRGPYVVRAHRATRELAIIAAVEKALEGGERG